MDSGCMGANNVMDCFCSGKQPTGMIVHCMLLGIYRATEKVVLNIHYCYVSSMVFYLTLYRSKYDYHFMEQYMLSCMIKCAHAHAKINSQYEKQIKNKVSVHAYSMQIIMLYSSMYVSYSNQSGFLFCWFMQAIINQL